MLCILKALAGVRQFLKAKAVAIKSQRTLAEINAGEFHDQLDRQT